MTDLDDAEADPEADPDTETDPDDTPDIEDSEMADFEAVADQIEAAPESDEDLDTIGVEGDQEDDGEESDEEARPPAQWGDLYVRGLTSTLNVVIDEYGGPESEPIDEQMARDLHLDVAFSEVMDKRGRADMPPEHEVLVGTLVLSGTVIAAKTDLLNEALDNMEVPA